MADEAAQKTRVKAENNPWYLLATLYGQPTLANAELRARNRTAWNRCMARALTEEARAVLLARKGHPAEELTPFSDEELHAIEGAFAERDQQAACTANAAIPDLLTSKVIDFSEVDFHHRFWVDGFVFSVASRFEGATFEEANFAGATFSGGASFRGATFSKWANFAGATFFGWTDFLGATFPGPAAFQGATFRSEVSFVDVEMNGMTSFEAAYFGAEPPRFFGAKLHEGTVWRHVHWPDPPKDSQRAGEFVDAYERLKLEMDRLKKHDDELNFFAREVQCRRVLLGKWKPVIELPLFGRRTVVLSRPASGLAISLYGILCDYGRSYARPLWYLLATVATGTLLFWRQLRWGHFGKAACLAWRCVIDFG